MFRIASSAASLAFPLVVGGVVFVSAGRWNLPYVWAVLGILAAFCIALATTADRGLLRERVKPGAGNQDRLTRPLGLPLLLAHWIVAGLDVGRFHWSPIPWPLQEAGVAGYAAAMVVLFRVMRANPFYSSVVRVQADRGQHAVTAGPYRWVRHPGYAATLFGLFSGSLALGSWLATIPALGFATLFIRRTLIEDRLLEHNLPGYAEYAGKVRYRLIPGVF
jgi:protein-S-isoprenylcysteine O-methyltransferase Ste14